MTDASPLRIKSLFNSPLETGTRAAIVLVEAFPRSFDLSRLVVFDHLVVHARDIGADTSLHPETKHRAIEMVVRRGLVERGLLLMASRSVVCRIVTRSGIYYEAGIEAGNYVSWLKSPYFERMKLSARFVVEALADKSDDDFQSFLSQHFERFALEFQALETPTASL